MSPDTPLPADESDAGDAASRPQGPAATPPQGLALEEAHFLHPSSVFFDVASHVRRYIIPSIVALYSAASGGVWGLGVAGIIFGGALLSTIINYLTLRYRLQGSDLVVTQGLLFRRVRAVPIRRIQNIDLLQNVLHRLLGVAEVRIETASGSEPEAVLRVLTLEQVDQLRSAVFGRAADPQTTAAELVRGADEPGGSPAAESSATAVVPPSHAAHEPQILHRVSLKQLLAAGVASNRGFVILSIAVGLLFQTGYSWSPTDKHSWKNARWLEVPEWVQGALPSMERPLGLAVAVVLAVLCLLIVMRLVGIGWYLLRFHDHTLSRRQDDLRIACGLLTKVSATIPRRRIQFISVHRPWLMRWMKLASIRIETAGGGGSQDEDASATVSRRWFLPVMHEVDVPRILSELRPGLHWDEASVEWHAVSPRTGRRLMRGAILQSLAISAVGWLIFRGWGLWLGPVVFPVLAYLAVRQSRAMRYALAEWGVVYRSGVLTRKLGMAFFDRMQVVSFRQSPFDRRWQMASLAVDTAAAGPADHRVRVDYLEADFAASQFRELTRAAATHQPTW